MDDRQVKKYEHLQNGGKMKKTIKKLSIMTLAVVMATGTMVGCTKKTSEGFASSSNISVITRENGSGTRGAFVELFGIEQKNEAGEKVDLTSSKASVNSSTSTVLVTVEGNKYAIGYVSLGSINDKVKVAKIDGVEASVENINNGTYKIARPFNIATKEEVSEVTQDFINFILSAEGQAIVEDTGYVKLEDTGAFASNGAIGTVKIDGSSSVSPLMEKLAEAYEAVNKEAKVEINTTDSSTGMSTVADGGCDIGMASRDVKDSEIEKGLVPTTIAKDGVAVIINKENTNDSLTVEQVMKIYIGDITKWSEISE